MRLNIEEDPSAADVEVSIRCPHVDEHVRRVAAAVELENRKLAGISNGFLRALAPADVLYIELVDGKTFLYAKDDVLESPVSLAELESELVDTEFVRATRQMLVNLMHVVGMRPYLNARLELVLDNDEHLIASRQFAPAIKKRIGL